MHGEQQDELPGRECGRQHQVQQPRADRGGGGAVQVAPAAQHQGGQPVQRPAGQDAGTAGRLAEVERGVEEQLQRGEQRRDPGVAAFALRREQQGEQEHREPGPQHGGDGQRGAGGQQLAARGQREGHAGEHRRARDPEHDRPTHAPKYANRGVRTR